jgi:hypothetical protein
MTVEEVDEKRKIREVFRTVLDPRRQETGIVLAAILDQAGYFSMNPQTVNPELVALCNWLLGEVGIVHPGNMVAYARAILGTANDDDLVAMRRKAEEDHET